MGSAPQLDVVDAGASTGRVRHDVVELEKPAFATPMPVVPYEPATSLIASHDRPPHRRDRSPRLA
jgi:hypothetical protein